MLPILVFGVEPLVQYGEILEDFAYGLQYVINHETTLPIAAPPENPVRVEFTADDKSDVKSIAVNRDGKELLVMQDVWMWANVKGQLIDGSLSQEEEMARRRLATVTGVAYKINEPRLLFAEGAVSFHGWTILDGARVECVAGGVVLTNTSSNNRAYRPHFTMDWADGTVCKIDERRFLWAGGEWIPGQPVSGFSEEPDLEDERNKPKLPGDH